MATSIDISVNMTKDHIKSKALNLAPKLKKDKSSKRRKVESLDEAQTKSVKLSDASTPGEEPAPAPKSKKNKSSKKIKAESLDEGPQIFVKP
jgi:hypothetical protein